MRRPCHVSRWSVWSRLFDSLSLRLRAPCFLSPRCAPFPSSPLCSSSLLSRATRRRRTARLTSLSLLLRSSMSPSDPILLKLGLRGIYIESRRRPGLHSQAAQKVKVPSRRPLVFFFFLLRARLLFFSYPLSPSYMWGSSSKALTGFFSSSRMAKERHIHGLALV